MNLINVSMCYLVNIPYTNFEERINYELKEEYGTNSRKKLQKIMIDDLEMSSEDEAKKLFLQEILSLEKRCKRYRLTSSKS